MSNRFMHDAFDCTIPCHLCGGDIDVRAEGHFVRECFVVEICTNKLTGKEQKLNEVQTAAIELFGADRYNMIETENREHDYAVAHEFQNDI